MTMEKVRQILNKNKQNILEGMIMIEAMGDGFNHPELRFDKGKVVELVIAIYRKNILNQIGKDVKLHGQYIEIKSKQNALCKINNKKLRKHKKSGRLCIPEPITIHNPQDNNPIEITIENINKWCSHAQAMVVMDTGNINSYALSVVSFENIKKLPIECFSGSSQIDVHLPIDIMETFITNEEIKDYLQKCTQDDIIDAKNKILRFLSEERCEKLKHSYETFIMSEYKRLRPNNFFYKIFDGWWKYFKNHLTTKNQDVK